MKKALALEQIKEAVRREEGAVAIYMRHLAALIKVARLAPAEREEMRAGIEYLVATNKAHKAALLEMAKRLEREAGDDI